jgi:membrane protein
LITDALPVSLTRSVVAAARRNRLTFHAAGITFYGLLSAFPAAIATISIYGLFADPTTLARELEGFAHVLPDSAADLVIEELELLISGPAHHLGIGAVVSILLTLWSASSALRALSVGLNRVYGVSEPRNFLLQRAVSYLLTLSFVGALVLQGALVASSPGWLRASLIVEVLRWPAIYVALVGAVALLYRVVPNRPWSDSRWSLIGPMVGSAGVVLATFGISVYGRHSANLNSTYGALAGVVILMLWFFVTTAAVLVGAEVDAVLDERGPKAEGRASAETTREPAGS